MLKYLIVQLDDTATSFCHYPNGRTERRLIPVETLKDALVWSMKENLNVQFVYPDEELSAEYKALIDTVDHVDIVSSRSSDEELKNSADVVVFDSPADFDGYPFKKNTAYVLRTHTESFLANTEAIKAILPSVDRLNVVFTDPEKFTDEMIANYLKALNDIATAVVAEYKNNHPVQVNILTDRIMLDKMNSCNAGDESITIAPDGQFYICPAFYLDGGKSVGNPETGVLIPNSQLYRLDHAPICHACDAFQCRRCTWLNRRLTLEVNTPSRQQCLMAHVERNASRELLAEIRKIGEFMPGNDIPEIDYLDPFDKIQK